MTRLSAPFRARHLTVATLGAVALLACGERRDVADLAGGVAPFEELRGTNAPALRSGGVRAFRRAAVPAPREGLHERIGEFDVVYEVPGFTGDSSGGEWPSEDALIYVIEAAHEWASDSAAAAAFNSAVRELHSRLGAGPHCLSISRPGFTLQVAEWDRGGGWSLTVSRAPAVHPAGAPPRPARHSIAVRREAITARLTAAAATEPDERGTWQETTCPTG